MVLTYWNGFTGGDRATYDKLIQKFNATHTHVQINADVQPWDSIAQKLPTAIAASSGPDLATPDYNVGTILQYANNGLIAPLDSLIGSGKNQIPSGALPKTITDGFTTQGHLYAAPANFSTSALYYNKALFKAAGIANPPTTMQQMRDDAVKLTKSNGSQYGIALADNNTLAAWPVLIWADGGDIVDSKNCSALASAETVSAVNSWAKLIHDDRISPVGLKGQDADNLFSAGKAAMEINGPSATGEYTAAKVDYGVVPMPTGSSGTPVTLAQTIPIVVNAKSPHRAQAMEFLAWLNSPAQQADLATGSGYPPSLTTMANDPAIKNNPVVQTFAKLSADSRLYLPTQKDFNQIDTQIFQPAIEKITRGSDAASTLKNAGTQINQLTGCK
ncbi:MAG: ABC transporter substrate-binding protein [Actinomycetota bacterium]|nr:ABC transporter substrate-binding protein [Actinomycetota bacterium]